VWPDVYSWTTFEKLERFAVDRFLEAPLLCRFPRANRYLLGCDGCLDSGARETTKAPSTSC
jgi:hypothetical protein